MSSITTLGASISVLVCKFRVKISFELTLCLFFCILGIRLPLLYYWFLLLFFPAERLICAACGSPATCLICLFLASWCTLLVKNVSRSKLPSLIVWDTNSSSFKKNQNISWCKILAVSGGYLGRLTWACTTFYHSSTLQFPCLKLVNPYFIALQNSSNLYHILSNLSSFWASSMTHIGPSPKSPLNAITFLHCCFSGRAASWHSSMFSHFNFHSRNQWYSPSFTLLGLSLHSFLGSLEHQILLGAHGYNQ